MRDLLPYDDLSCGERQEQFSMLDAFQTEQRVCEFANDACSSSQRDHFHTIVVTDVDVQRRNDQPVPLMLDLAHPLRNLALVVVND